VDGREILNHSIEFDRLLSGTGRTCRFPFPETQIRVRNINCTTEPARPIAVMGSISQDSYVVKSILGHSDCAQVFLPRRPICVHLECTLDDRKDKSRGLISIEHVY
jgi:hypothetical protein